MSEPTLVRNSTYENYKAIIDEGKSRAIGSLFTGQDGKLYETHILIKNQAGEWMDLNGLSGEALKKIEELAKFTLSIHTKNNSDLTPEKVAYVDRDGVHLRNEDKPLDHRQANMDSDHLKIYEKNVLGKETNGAFTSSQLALINSGNNDNIKNYFQALQNDYLNGLPEDEREAKNKEFNKQVHRLVKPDAPANSLEDDYVDKLDTFSTSIVGHILTVLDQMREKRLTAMHAWIGLSNAVANVWNKHQKDQEYPDPDSVTLFNNSKSSPPTEIPPRSRNSSFTGDLPLPKPTLSFPEFKPYEDFLEQKRKKILNEINVIDQTLNDHRNALDCPFGISSEQAEELEIEINQLELKKQELEDKFKATYWRSEFYKLEKQIQVHARELSQEPTLREVAWNFVGLVPSLVGMPLNDRNRLEELQKQRIARRDEILSDKLKEVIIEIAKLQRSLHLTPDYKNAANWLAGNNVALTEQGRLALSEWSPGNQDFNDDNDFLGALTAQMLSKVGISPDKTPSIPHSNDPVDRENSPASNSNQSSGLTSGEIITRWKEIRKRIEDEKVDSNQSEIVNKNFVIRKFVENKIEDLTPAELNYLNLEYLRIRALTNSKLSNEERDNITYNVLGVQFEKHLSEPLSES